MLTADGGGDDLRGAARASLLLGRLAERGPIDLVLVHDPASGPVEQRGQCLAAADVVAAHRFLAVVGAPLPRSGLLREVHHHHGSDRPPPSAADLAIASFTESAPTPYDLLWFGDLASMARVRNLHRRVPAVVDIDHRIDLGGARSRRAARSWGAAADLVTVDDPARREELAVPGALVVATAGDPTDTQMAAFDAAVATVLRRATAYRPVRS